MEDVVIVGASVAGLCCAIQLRALDVPVVCVEARQVGQPAVCGDYIASDALPILARWGIKPSSTLSDAAFIFPKGKITLPLDPVAGVFERMELVKELADVAVRQGVQIIENFPVYSVRQESSFFEIAFEKERWQTKNIVFSSGKVPIEGVAKRALPFLGMSTYIEGSQEGLKMHAFQGGYLGMAPVDSKRINCALIAKNRDGVKKILEAASLPEIGEWKEAALPHCGYAFTPNWPRAYCIGDAYAFIPPCIGKGGSNAIQGALLAADLIKKEAWEFFYKQMKQKTAKQMRWGMALHKALCAPSLSAFFPRLHTFFPGIAQFVLNNIKK